MRSLLQAYREEREKRNYAYCYICRELFLDDIPMAGNLSCPNDFKHVLERRFDLTKLLINEDTTD